MSNIKIRQKMIGNAIKSYQLADAVGISPSTLSVWLRKELTGNRLKRVEKALDILISKK